jgi:hypothetical protein
MKAERINKMKQPVWVMDYATKQFSSGGYMGDDGKAWIASARSWLRAFVKEIGGDSFEFHPNHYCFSCAFCLRGQWWYIMSGDCRFKVCDWMLIRKTTGPKDYTGGINQHVPYSTATFERDLRNILQLKG